MKRIFVGLFLLVAACKGKDKGKPDESAKSAASSVDAAAAKAAAAVDAATGKAGDKPALTAAQRKQYRKHLHAGRKLGGDKKWGEAVVELQAALTVIPDDPRASAELGWAAFQAGDYVIAKKANAVAVRSAGDPKVRAQALYNLGRVAEATGDKDAATRLYTESLALRPNKTVEARLKGLGAPLVSAAPADEFPCRVAVPTAEAQCDCLAKNAPTDFVADDAEPECELESTDGPADLEIARVDLDNVNAEYYLLLETPKGWVTIEHLGYLYEGGMMGVSGEWEIPPITEQSVGGHRVVTVTTIEHHHDHDLGIDEEEDLDTTTETLCVLGDAPACPMSVPTRTVYVRDRMGMMDDSEIDAEAKSLMTPGLPIREEVELELKVGDDGVATVVLKKGSATEYTKSFLGPHKLW
jgi:hypothetical protein